MSPFFTPLRYPGGKGKLAGYVKAIITENGLLDGHYVEPFAGGAAIAMELLLQDYVSHVHINDIDRSVFAFWHSVLNETDALCELIERTPVTMASWFEQRSIQLAAGEHDLLTLGFSTFFMNRCNRSGIIKAGVIGGKAQAGKWKLDARFNKPDLIERIRQIARFRTRVSLRNLDVAAFLSEVIPSTPANTLTYLDPPYYVKGEGLYANHFVHADHSRLAQRVLQGLAGAKWIVSYDNAPAIAEMYPSVRNFVYHLSYSAQDRYRGAEIMFFSDGLHIPEVPKRVPIYAA